jgi:hypothetical protein
MTSTRTHSAAPDDAPFYLAAASSSIVLTLVYFSLFQHPLREEELLAHTHFYPISKAEGRAAIRSLLDRGILESVDGLFCLQGEGPSAAVRAEREARAATWKPRVGRSIRALSRLPFLRGLAISGSMSKGTQDLDGDIDFFVLTAPNRLWTARFFAALMVKLLPKAQRVNYCLNYYLPEDRLSIPDRTLFSATEVAFLKPVLNGELFSAFFELNAWVKTFYPNWEPPSGAIPNLPRGALQRLVEWPLSGRLGDFLETWVSRWLIRRQQRQMDNPAPGRSATEVRLNSGEFKGHTKGHHGRTHQAWLERVDRLEAGLSIRLIRWPWAEAWTSRAARIGSFRLPTADSSRPILPLWATTRRALPPR